MNELFAQCGWEGPAFLQLADTVKETVPVVHSSGLYLEDGVLTDSLTPVVRPWWTPIIKYNTTGARMQRRWVNKKGMI